MSDNTIMLTQGFRSEEALAAAILSPGHLLELNSAAAVIKHATEGGLFERAVALEDALQGNTIDDAYAIGDRVIYNLVDPGDEARVFLKAGENVAIGAQLCSAGDGTLIAVGSVSSGVTVKQTVVAKEAVDLSGSGDVDTLIPVRFL